MDDPTKYPQGAPSSLGVNRLVDQALAFLRSDDPGAAEECLRKAKSLGVTVPDLDLVHAIYLLKVGRNAEAREALESELRAFPDNSHASSVLNQLQAELGAPSSPPSGAAQGSAEVLRLLQSAVDLLREGKTVDAMRAADQAVALGVQVPGMHYVRVVCLNAVGRREEALEAARQELLINPEHGEARAEYERLSSALTRSKPLMLNPEQRSYRSQLDHETLHSIQKAAHNYSYRGVPMIKNPFDFALYPLLLWNYKPKTIIEIGSKNGGSALWFADMMDNFGIDGHVYSLDIVKVDSVSHPRVTFLEGDGRNPGASFPESFIAALPRPLLVVEDADHSYETSSAVLDFFHRVLGPEEYIVIEDDIISDLEKNPQCNSGPHRALKEFIARHPGEYDMDPSYSDFFGYNFTWCTNGFLRKKKCRINPSVSADLVREFNADDSATQGIESQMSTNERFQLYSAIRGHLRVERGPLTFVEIGSYSGASLALESAALLRFGLPIEGFAVEPGGTPQFYEILKVLADRVRHLKMLSHEASRHLAETFGRAGRAADMIMVDGDHSYQGVRQDIVDYYPLLKPGGLMIFHDYLPPLTPENRDAIFFHHGGKEPGIRQACEELMEREYRCQLVEMPLLYPEDPTQTQVHLPVIPGVFSTLRVYRKPG